jgi:hypothetical protein
VPDAPIDVLESRPGWWTSLPRSVRRLGTAVVVLVLLVAGALWIRDRAADRERAQRIDLVTSLVVEVSSTSPPGGRVSYFVVVRNRGQRPVTLTAVTGGDAGLRLRLLDDDERTVPAGAELSIPLSVRLTCSGAGSRAAPLPAVLALRRADGGVATHEVALEPAILVRDVAGTLCSVRPDLRNHELSGPVLQEVAAKSDTDG